MRLLTLTGPGGIGKTRLALSLAEQLAADVPDGVAFVPLASLADPALVESAIAEAVGVREAAGQTLRERLTAHLVDKRMLLVLDNFEHLVPAAPLVAALLGACPYLKVLSTSRAVLHLSGEHTYPVPPLALPHPDRLPPLSDLGQSAAVRLFVDRVRAAQSDFILTDENAPAVAEIVRRLDGLPLALELAAARVRVLSPAALLARLDRRLPLLTAGAQDLPDRQRTMRDAIAWSYDLLSRQDQVLFRCLAVFAGGWTLEAATVVSCGRNELDVLVGLEALTTANLVQATQQPDGEWRFSMLETIREFGVEQLAASGEEGPTRQAHAKHFLALAASAHQQEWPTCKPKVWLDRLEVEHDNVRASLDWTLASNGQELLGFAADLGSFWSSRGPAAEGRTWLERALAVDAGGPTVDRLRALAWLGWFVHWQGDIDQGASLIEEGLHLARSLGEREQEADLLGDLGDLLHDSGEIDRAEQCFLESLVLWQDLGDQTGVAWNRARLARVAGARGDIVRQESLATKALRIFRDHEDAEGIAEALLQLGSVAQQRGDLEHAAAYVAEGLARVEERGLLPWVAAGTGMLGDMRREHGDFTGARVLLERSRAIAKDLGWGPDEACALFRLALVATEAGEATEAAVLCQQAIARLRQSPAKRELAAVLTGAGDIHLTQGDPARAAASYREGLSLFREIGDSLGQAAAVCAIGGLAAHLGRPREAARLLAAAAAKREAHGAGLVPSERRREGHALEVAQTALGEVAFAVEWEAGRNLRWEAACEEALSATTTEANEGSAIGQTRW